MAFLQRMSSLPKMSSFRGTPPEKPQFERAVSLGSMPSSSETSSFGSFLRIPSVRTTYTNAEDLMKSLINKPNQKFIVYYKADVYSPDYTNLGKKEIDGNNLPHVNANEVAARISNDESIILNTLDKSIKLEKNGKRHDVRLVPAIFGGKYRLNKKTKRRLSRKQKTKRKVSKNKTKRNI